MNITKIEINYQSNYNGCTVFVHTADDPENGLDAFDVEYTVKDADTLKKVETLQGAVVEEAYKAVIKSGRLEGTFNGDIDELCEFAFNKARELFGDDVEIDFEEDDSST